MPKRLIGAVWNGDVLLAPEPGVVFDDEHPLVRKHPEWFADVVVLGAASRPVEQATAAPGERRGVRR